MSQTSVRFSSQIAACHFVLATLALAALCTSRATPAGEPVEEIVVLSTRTPQAIGRHIGNADVLDGDTVRDVSAGHVHELLTRVPGVWVSRGSGQESLPSIRSPVLTGAGSCGAFLTLEDGVPSRPNGFCNVNQLLELPTELADAIEVIRGPGTALYGSNALHGILNVRLPEPGADTSRRLSLEAGSSRFTRAALAAQFDGRAPVALGANVTRDGGFRDDSGFRQYKAYVRRRWTAATARITATVSFSDLDQETAGFIFGENAFADPARNRSNLNPEAFRKADSQRVALRLEQSLAGFDLDLRPYLRRTDMTFLQHFLPGQPLEENGHRSAGLLAQLRRGDASGHIAFGLDADYADVFLRQTQAGPTEGSVFLAATRPQGKHYDYDVAALAGAVYAQGQWQPAASVTLSAGLRAEFVRYRYRNNMQTGNTRDDGSACEFGGCFYSRPGDRQDRFFNLAPKAGILWQLSTTTALYASATRGFRAPQMTELYRLQSGQLVSDLASESLDSLEVGLRTRRAQLAIEGTVFAMRKRNSVFRDAEGFNVSGARTRHEGLELAADFGLAPGLRAVLNATYARHTYDFDQIAARGETFVSGRDVDTAPRWQASAELAYAPGQRVNAAVQWLALGPYFLDAQNERRYAGHTLGNLRIRYALGRQWSLTARINNVLDRDIADRADFAFGNFRYLPGRGREWFLQLRYASSG